MHLRLAEFPRPAGGNMVEVEPGTKQTVMVVDDEPTIVEVVSGYLKRAGFDVTTAADGPSAIADALKDPPDLIVLDLMLPEINGLEVMRVLVEVEKLDLAVILLTSKSEESDRLVGLRRGAVYLWRRVRGGRGGATPPDPTPVPISSGQPEAVPDGTSSPPDTPSRP